MNSVLRLLRVRQWVKNLFIILPGFFGGILSQNIFPNLAWGFVAFCSISSSVYVLNDIRDVHADRLHPKKKNRPIASGAIQLQTAYIILSICVVTSLLICYLFVPVNGFVVVVVYFFLNLLYSFKLKQIAILDLLIVSSGFLLRVIFGGELVEIEVSFWLLLITFLFSMFIVLGKRRDDFKPGPEEAARLRLANRKYTLQYLDYSITMFSALIIVSYIMYTYFSQYFSSNIYLALLSSILVVAGLLRYLQAIFVENMGGSPTDFALKDRFIQICVIIWIGVFGYLIYFK